MRVRVGIPAIVGLVSLLLAGCGSTSADSSPAHPSTTAGDGPAAAASGPRSADRVLIVGGGQGTVSVRTTDGTVAFRAPYGRSAPDSSTVVQAQPIDTGT